MTITRPVAAKRNLPVARRQTLPAPMPVAPASFAPDPYLDYGRFLTPEGGILIVYKDIDGRLRQTLWRLLAWTAATGLEAWYLLDHAPFQARWIAWPCLLIMALLNWLVVRSPVEIYRTIEIRHDAMILDGAEVFWRRHMESWPAFQKDQEGNQVLRGVYGTRHVEFATVRRFDEKDQSPEVFSAHLQDAFQQLWQGAL